MLHRSLFRYPLLIEWNLIHRKSSPLKDGRMDVIEPIKRVAEKATGIGVPAIEEAIACVSPCRPLRMKFRDDGYIPNNPKFPLLLFRKALRFNGKHDPAAVIEQVLIVNGWGDAWRMAFMTSCITTPISTRYWASHGARALFGWAAIKGEL
jgi:hypothetical protein